MIKKPTRKQVYELLDKYLLYKPNGAHYSEILQFLKEKLPDVPENTLHGSIWHYKKDRQNKKKVVILERGLYILSIYYNPKLLPTEKQIREENFYEKLEFYLAYELANYLVNELKECTKAITLKHNEFQDKLGTPNILGVYKSSELYLPPEIISAKINIDQNQLINSLGQCCAYKIFSHKVYLCVPKQTENEIILKIQSICSRFGIGLITFDKDNIENPNFRIIIKATKSEPDYFYVNDYIAKLSKKEILTYLYRVDL